MNYWLLKTEPSDYSFDDLLKELNTTWTGVSNALALKHLRSIQKGDTLLIYHTGNEKSVVGTARVTKADPRGGAIGIEPGQRLKNPVSLATIKSDKRFSAWPLVTIGRLSVVPTTPVQFQAILELGGGLQR